MGSSDLEYGWDKKYFVLSHVKISRKIELQQPNKNGDLFVRDPPRQANESAGFLFCTLVYVSH